MSDIQVLSGTLPGYKRHDSGLIVPEAIAKQREVWTRQEWALLERTMKLLESRAISVFLKCEHQGCGKAPMTRTRRVDGGITLSCDHCDREFQKAY